MARKPKDKSICVVPRTNTATPEELRLNKLYTKYMNITREDVRVLGEKPYVPYYLELMEQGGNHIHSTDTEWLFDVRQEDKDLFSELSNAVQVKLIFDPLTECYTVENYVEKQG